MLRMVPPNTRQNIDIFSSARSPSLPGRLPAVSPDRRVSAARIRCRSLSVKLESLRESRFGSKAASSFSPPRVRPTGWGG